MVPWNHCGIPAEAAARHGLGGNTRPAFQPVVQNRRCAYTAPGRRRSVKPAANPPAAHPSAWTEWKHPSRAGKHFRSRCQRYCVPSGCGSLPPQGPAKFREAPVLCCSLPHPENNAPRTPQTEVKNAPPVGHNGSKYCHRYNGAVH